MSAVIGLCQRCSCPIERGDLRCAMCGLGTPVSDAASTTVRIQIQRCEGCGAAAAYDAAARAPVCAFCASVMHTEELVDPTEQTESYLPFRVSRREAAAGLKKWLGSRGFFRPGDLATGARLEALQPILWVAWVFDARSEVTWTADSNEGAFRSAWAPHAGRAQLNFDDLLVSASRGLNDDEVDALTPSYDLGDQRPEPAAEPEGIVELDSVHVETFDVQRSAARRRITAAIEHAAASVIAEAHVPGSRTRNVHAAVLLRGLETRRLAFPAWVLAYRYKNELYRAVVSGQDAEVVMGKAPLSPARILLAVAGGVLLLATIAAVAAAR